MWLQEYSVVVETGLGLSAIMSEQLKFIVEELNKEPFKKNYNLIRYGC